MLKQVLTFYLTLQVADFPASHWTNKEFSQEYS